MATEDASSKSGWGSAWIDGVAFAGGLALAWFGRWQTKDLVWSLWLSSLLVGYAMILWMIFSPGIWIAFNAWRNRGMVDAHSLPKAAGMGVVYLFGALFMLGFFTIHFGMFHFVHSAFLSMFFPVDSGTVAKNAMPNLALYRAVFLAYWPFVLVAALAERKAFRWPGAEAEAKPDTAVTPAAIARRKAAQGLSGVGSGMMTPYRNVVRLHLLIFFFAFARYAHLENFAVYAVVYAVYFFPWRLLRRPRAVPVG